VFVYLFAWGTAVLGGRLGSCHTLEIPFVFDNVRTATLTGTDPARLGLAKDMSKAWVSFARTGMPMPGWPAYSTEARATMIFDVESRVEKDPCGAERRAWGV
jgi:para-nitrobenzyl esterase